MTITYHQVGGCTGFATSSGATGVGPNAAYVIFDIERIDNSGGSTTFSFDPSNLFVPQATPAFFDQTLMLYSEILGPFSAPPETVIAGQNISVNGFGATVVATVASDGATEVDHTVYPLNYKRASTDPPVTLVNSNPARTTWPLTQDCHAITLQ